MNKELEEAALIYASKPRQFGVRMTFIDGAKWQAERMYSIDFIMWYSGMDKEKIENAHKRWINETFKSE
jgi:hypothetical protein